MKWKELLKNSTYNLVPTLSSYIEQVLKSADNLTLRNPLIKMPVGRFRELSAEELGQLQTKGWLHIGTTSDAISRNLHKNYRDLRDSKGEHAAFVSYGTLEAKLASNTSTIERVTLAPILLRRVVLQALPGGTIKASIIEDEEWNFNSALTRILPEALPQDSSAINPQDLLNYYSALVGNRARITSKSYIGLFSSQWLRIMGRFDDPLIREHLAQSNALRAKLQGVSSSDISANDDALDDGIEDMAVVLPFDDSQLHVLQRADLGANLQVEGPPGTGKSQTIANLIANAMWRGKRVLFVCDKKPAIEQVEERLVKCGLAPTLLNLHDDDITALKFLNIAVEKFKDRPKPPLTQALEDLASLRTQLNQRVVFGRDVPHRGLGVTNHEALCGLIRLRRTMAPLQSIPIESLQNINPKRLSEILSHTQSWVGLEPIIANQNSPWNSLSYKAFRENPMAVDEVANAGERLLNLPYSLDSLKDLLAQVGWSLSLSTPKIIRQLSRVCELVSTRPFSYLHAIDNSEITLDGLLIRKDCFNRKLALSEKQYPIPLNEIIGESERKCILHLAEKETSKTWRQLLDKKAEYQQWIGWIESLQSKYGEFSNELGLLPQNNRSDRITQLQLISDLLNLQIRIPEKWWDSDCSPVLLVEQWQAALRNCAGKARAERNSINFVVWDQLTEQHVSHIGRKAETGFNAINYCLTYVSNARVKFALHQLYSLDRKEKVSWQELSLHAMSARNALLHLLKLSELHPILTQLTETFVSNSASDKFDIEPLLQEDNLNRLRQAAELVEVIKKRSMLFDSGSNVWRNVWEVPSTRISDLFVWLEANVHLLPSEHVFFADALVYYRKRENEIENGLAGVRFSTGSLELEIENSLKANDEFRACENTLSDLSNYLALSQIKAFPAAWDEMQKALEWRDELFSLGQGRNLDFKTKLWKDIQAKAVEFLTSFSLCEKDLAKYFSHFQKIDELPLEAIVDSVAKLLSELQFRDQWVEKRSWNDRLILYPELAGLWSSVTKGELTPNKAKEAFCFNALLNLKPFVDPYGNTLKGLVSRFQNLDGCLGEWSTDKLKRKLHDIQEEAERLFPSDIMNLKRLANMVKPQGKVREHLNGKIQYLLKAKQCWLMSPSSIANLFDDRIFEATADQSHPFDLVIFDEASQVRVADGLLAMSYGAQVIIVGDKNQLQPTDFFAAQAATNDDDDPENALSQSLLHEFTGALEEVMLKSHYRSETPDLIRFSNQWFYKGELEFYPPARIAGIGRILHPVPDGIYDSGGRRNNRREAEEVVELIAQHFKGHPNKSLGVVTMNIPQMELVDELLTERYDELGEFTSDSAKFFLRNLENVQGDEMDRIILSLTYGKNKEDHFSAGFLGPLTKPGGANRLNVAITRQRSGLTIVTSLTAARLEESAANSSGFKCLLGFLKELEESKTDRNYGIDHLPFRINDGHVSSQVFCESPFEEQVVEFLENEGYEIQCQVGCGRFRIDIVVREKGRNLLAVECDGRAYHSSRSARTRDRARERILRDRGWEVHRVWSTNWWYTPESEKQALVEAIRSARTGTQSTAKNM